MCAVFSKTIGLSTLETPVILIGLKKASNCVISVVLVFVFVFIGLLLILILVLLGLPLVVLIEDLHCSR